MLYVEWDEIFLHLIILVFYILDLVIHDSLSRYALFNIFIGLHSISHPSTSGAHQPWTLDSRLSRPFGLYILYLMFGRDIPFVQSLHSTL